MGDLQKPIRNSSNEPTLKELLDQHKREIMLQTNCHGVARVQSFDTENQTIVATMMYKKSYLQRNDDGTYSTVLKDYPILLDVPVVIIGGGTAALTMPIAVGDECLILFNDRDIDNWHKSGQVGELSSGRLHSFADGFALVGVRSMKTLIEDYDASKAVLFNGALKVSLSTTKLSVENASQSLQTILDDLITAIKAITISGGAVSAGSQTALAAIATRLGSLME